MKPLKVIIILCSLLAITKSLVRFSNIKCLTLDPAFSSFSACNLKMINRGVVGLNMTCNLHKIPVENVSVSFVIYKKSNGYNPYFPNVTFDFCHFLNNREKHPLVKILADFLLRNSNINHTCPYDHDIIVQNLVLDQKLFTLVPLQLGEYMLRIMVGAYNSWKADVRVYISIINLQASV